MQCARYLCHAATRCATLQHAVPRCNTLCHAVQRRKDNEDSILAVYIGQLCQSGKLCTDDASRQRAVVFTLKVHEARRAAAAFAPSGHSSTCVVPTALSLTHLAAAADAPLPAPATTARAAHAVLNMPCDTVTTGATDGRDGGRGSEAQTQPGAPAGLTNAMSTGNGPGGSQGGLTSAQGVLEPSKPHPLTLDGMLSMHGVGIDLQQQLEGLLKAQCRAGGTPGADNPAAAPVTAPKELADTAAAAIAPQRPEGGLGWPATQRAAGSMHQARMPAHLRYPLGSMHDVRALEQQQAACASAGAHAGGSAPQQLVGCHAVAMLWPCCDVCLVFGVHVQPPRCACSVCMCAWVTRARLQLRRSLP